MQVHPTPTGINFVAALMISLLSGFATASQSEASDPEPTSTLIQKTTSGYLPAGTLRLGFQSDYGLSDRALIGTEMPALLAGAFNIYGKAQVWQNGRNSLSIGTDLVYTSRDTLLWGGQQDNFERLNIHGIHPRLVFTQALSSRLLLHSSWGAGWDRGDLELSDAGKRRLWRSKYPNGDYEARTGDGKPPSNNGQKLEEDFSITHRSLLLQSLLGFAQERFELSGEILRSPRETLLISAHIARFNREELKAQRLGLSLAQQWRSPRFGFRIGVGALYQVLSGRDFDDEAIEDARWLPTTDLDVFFLL